jgi:hypothetical protein
MTTNSVVRARIDEQIKNEAAAVLRAMGLTTVGPPGKLLASLNADC